ncbi:MAG: hypothetical protein PHW82_02920 [Bacteroidales bacterium]|nr:hypothetical protein [Bacteroidales bacterium]
MEIYFEYPYYLIIVAVIVAAAISFFLYYQDKTFKDLEVWKKWTMTSLRFVFVLIILLLLLSPVIKTKGLIIQKPVIVVAQDNSSSLLLNKDSVFYQNQYKTNLDKLITALGDNYDVRYLQFSETTENDSLLNFSGKMSDVSSVFPEVVARYAGMNLGAVILATDGIYNKGINPIYSKNLDFPVYSIAMGDTVSQKDLVIDNLVHNKIAFLGNKFPLRIYISAEKCNEQKAKLTISRNDKIIYSSDIDIPKDGSINTIDIDLDADKLGVQKYDVKIEHLENEISYANNESVFVINVIDNRNKILLLANAPHPDNGAISFAIKDNPDFEIHTEFIADFNGSVTDYDLVVLHQLPSVHNNINSIISEIDKNSIPALFILGKATDLKNLNNLDKGLQINALSSNADDAQAFFNQDFVSFSLSFDEKEFFDGMYALKVVFGDYKTLADVKVLLYQKINGIKTDKPLIMFSEQNGVKTGFITGEGIWRWRIDDYRKNTSHDNYKMLINRVFQYMIVKKIQDKLLVESAQVFSENQNVVFTAEFYNEAYELVNGLGVKMSLVDNNDKEYNYFFGNQGDAYRLDIGRIPAGEYSYVVESDFDNKTYTAKGKIIVKSINIEALNTTANHIVLERLAEQTGGKVFYPHNMDEIPVSIKSNSEISSLAYEKEKLYTLTDLFFLFFLIIAFAGTEWSLRKYWGGY